MIVVGLLAVLVAAAAVACLLGARGAGRRLETLFRRAAWVPPLGFLAAVALVRPLGPALGYFAVLPPLLAVMASLVLAVVGATLAAAARERGEPVRALVRATAVAASPAALVAAWVAFDALRLTLR